MPLYIAQEFIDAIPGTAGIKRWIAAKVGCRRHTVREWIRRDPEVRAAYEQEIEEFKDKAESLLIHNIEMALKLQEELKRPVDSSDARWYLARKAADRGYSSKQQIGPMNPDDLLPVNDVIKQLLEKEKFENEDKD